MQDHSAKELKGHNILALERFQDDTRWMIEFRVLRPSSPYGVPGDEMRLFLTEKEYREAVELERKRDIRIRTHAHVTEGHITPIIKRKLAKRR